MKEGERRPLHSTGGRTPYKQYKSRKSQGNARTLMLPDQFFGEERQNVRRGTKESTKIEVTSLTRFLGKTFEPGMTRGTYDAWRGLFTCATAAFSADIPSVDALPYRLVLRLSFGSVRSVISTKK